MLLSEIEKVKFQMVWQTNFTKLEATVS
jgi:hypothetical protein